LLWHPHQKLWNWRLIAVVKRVFRSQPAVGQATVRLIILTDSLLLLARVVGRRLTTPAARRRPGTRRPEVLHIDCGPHKEGSEIVWMHRWFSRRYHLRTVAFEAGGDQYAQASRNLAGIADLDLQRAAVVGPEHNGDSVTFHLGHAGGRGSSLFAARGGEVEEVPAVRLSEVLGSISPKPDAVILRMNIEGAENFVIEDLIRSGQDGAINGYYGMWDDLSKIDPNRDREFRRLLRRHGIRTLSFNERDLEHPLRRLAIRTDVETSVRQGLAWQHGR
jgi:FkbM family methyltransferase